MVGRQNLQALRPPLAALAGVVAGALALAPGSALASSPSSTAETAATAAATSAITPYLTPLTSADDDSLGADHDDRVLAGSATGSGRSGRFADHAAVADDAGLDGGPGRRRPGTVLIAPADPLAAGGLTAGSSPRGRFVAGLPMASSRVTSRFGLRWHPLLGGLRVHAGIDFAAAAGTPVTATADGVVGAARWAGGYGLLVALEHGGGRQTRYAHLSRLAVAAGQQVRKGEVIGFVGSTGRSTGPHLHYETRVDGQAVDPLQR